MSERRIKEEIDSGTAPTRRLVDALDAIPIFPLPQVVLFPHAVLPLHVFEPRYRAMLQDCLASHGALVIAQLLAGEDEHGRPRIAPIAGGGIVVEHQPLADGRSNIVVRGQARLLLEEHEPEDPARRPYRIARATVLDDLPHPVAEHDRTALAAAATMFAGEVKRHDPTFTFALPQTNDAGELADLCAYQLVIDASSRQAVLEERDPRVRVEMVLNHLALQHGAMMKTDGDRVLN
ncbi:MAG: LON peptidase substrate-binding domain-containing protein [Labilithrix sp.]|nr:LON peptidase substrate-binding domain-containing protein [Labilithrix sp.]